MKKYKIYRRKTRNSVARELEDKKYRPRTVRPDKIYDRNKFKDEFEEILVEDEDLFSWTNEEHS